MTAATARIWLQQTLVLEYFVSKLSFFKGFTFEQYNFTYETHYEKVMEALRIVRYPVDNFRKRGERDGVFSGGTELLYQGRIIELRC